jgi:hypothetical protein
MKTILLTAIAVVIPVVALAQSATPANPSAADLPPPVSAPLIDQMATGAVEVPRRILGPSKTNTQPRTAGATIPPDKEDAAARKFCAAAHAPLPVISSETAGR